MVLVELEKKLVVSKYIRKTVQLAQVLYSILYLLQQIMLVTLDRNQPRYDHLCRQRVCDDLG